VRALVETGAFTGDRGAYRLARPLPALQVPATVQAVLAARIDRLSPQDKTLLQSASVLGTDVPLVLLQAIAESTEDELLAAIGRLQAAEFLYETSIFPDLEYTFKHALTHDVVYGSLLQDRRRTLHGRILETIEQHYPDRLTEHVERLAHHATRGEVWGRALTYLRQAGARALARSAYREATAYLEQALSALGHLPEDRPTREQAIDVRLDLYSALLPLNQLRPLLQYVREAEALAVSLNDRRRLGWARLHVSHLLVLVDEAQRSVELAHDVVEMARTDGDTLLEAVALLWAGCGRYALGEHRRAVHVLRESLLALGNGAPGAWPTQASLPAVLLQVTARSYQSMFLAEIGEFAGALAIGREGLEVAKQINHPWNVVLACWQVGSFHLAKGDLEHATRLLRQAMSLGRQWDSTRSAALAACWLGYTRALSGHVHEGIGLVEQGLRETDAVGLTWLRGRRLAYLGEVYLLGGRNDEAGAVTTEALAFCRQRKERGMEAWALRLRGEVASSRAPADVGTAETSYCQAIALATELEMRPLVAHCHLGLGKLCRHTGDGAKAREHLTTASTMYREMDMGFWLEKADAELDGIE
jgi:tetratricopeptide (TPR) repeat protein